MITTADEYEKAQAELRAEAIEIAKTCPQCFGR